MLKTFNTRGWRRMIQTNENFDEFADNCAYLSDGECDFDDEFKCDCAEKDCPRVEKG